MDHPAIDHGCQSEGRMQATPMRADHLAQAHTLSRALNWPYRLEDWAFALDLGEGLVVERDGRLLGTALWWPHGDDFATIGMVIVAPEARRQGIGGLLMEGLLARTGERRVLLNSTQDGFALYLKLGFAPCGAVHQHQAVLAMPPKVASDAVIRPFARDDRPGLLALDRAGSGMDRARLIDALCAMGDVSLLERDGVVQAYACRRIWGRGFVIGPVVARAPGDARALIAALAADLAGQFLRVDVTLASGLSPWLEGIGLPQVDEVVAMARGAPPAPGDGAAILALSNQSLG